MAAVATCSDFGAQENKVCHCSHCFPIYLPGSEIVVIHLLSCVLLFVTPWTAALQASLSFHLSQSLLKVMSIESTEAIQPSHPHPPSPVLSFPASGSFPMSQLLVFWMLSFKPAFSLFSFTSIKRLFSSSSLSAIRVVSSDIWSYWYFSWKSWF